MAMQAKRKGDRTARDDTQEENHDGITSVAPDGDTKRTAGCTEARRPFSPAAAVASAAGAAGVRANVSVRQAGDLMGCSPRQVNALFHAGALRGYRIGMPGSQRAIIRIFIDSIADFQSRNSNEPIPAVPPERQTRNPTPRTRRDMGFRFFRPPAA